jgi:hypothetical protein
VTSADPQESPLPAPYDGILVEPPGGSDAAVVVLGGSSGRVERERARVLARQGLRALAFRWFGGPGQPPGICEVPLETFTAAVDLLRDSGARRIGVLGLSKGAEAALLTAVHDPRIDAVVALSPTAWVWCNAGPGHDGRDRPQRSSWTWRGQPLPFVPVDDNWTRPAAGSGPVAIRGWYELSERSSAHLLPAAGIPVEQARADLLLVAGGDDAMWPSHRYAETLTVRRRRAGLPVRLVARLDAGHRPVLPGEAPPAASPHFAYGGSASADAALGRAAWPHILAALTGTRAAG